MNQNIWGPHLWFVLHTITFNYPVKPTIEDKKNYKTFLLSLEHILPCNICRRHFKRHIQENPPYTALKSRDSFIKWMIDLHNEVNGETGKKSTYTYKEILNKYEKIYNMRINNNIENINEENNLNRNYQVILFMIMVSIFIYYIFNFKK
jgi:hypothetical protein